jgi:hypothetical protein
MQTMNIPRPKLCCTVAAIVVACGWLAVWIATPAKITAVLVAATRAAGSSSAQAALMSGHTVLFGLINAVGLVILGLAVVAVGRMMRASCRLAWQHKRARVPVFAPTVMRSAHAAGSSWILRA